MRTRDLPRGSSRLAGLALVAMLGAPSAQALTPISCDTTPFGKQARVFEDLEFVDVIGTTNAATNLLDEYQPVSIAPGQPLPTAIFNNGRNDLLQGALVGSGAVFLKALSVDLNGDGLDEIVAGFRMPDASLKLGIYERTSDGASLIGTYASTEGVGAFDMRAGDFRGLKQGQQQLAIMWQATNGANSGHTHVRILDGTAGGTLYASSSGDWISSETAVLYPKLARGDFLLDGRDQLVVVSYTSATKALNVNLLEFLTPNSLALPTYNGSSNIGSVSFVYGMGSFYDPSTGYNAPVDVSAMTADGGDIVDSAAAELVVHMQVRMYPANSTYTAYDIGQRLYHFTRVPRDPPGLITSIGMATGLGGGVDSTQLIYTSEGIKHGGSGGNQPGSPYPFSFQTTIADIDHDGKGEILLARNSPLTSEGTQLAVKAYKAKTVASAGFTYAVQGDHSTTNFANTSKDATTYAWNFGDSATSTAVSPVHKYLATGTFTVTLQANPGAVVYSTTVHIDGVNVPSGGIDADHAYRLITAPPYWAAFGGSYTSSAGLQIAAGDMNRDGNVEIMVLGRDSSFRIARVIGNLDAQGALVSHTDFEAATTDYHNLTAMSLLAPDFDGDSVQAVISASGCGNITDNQFHFLIWEPPYFKTWQPQGQGASYGTAVTNSATTEVDASTYTSASVTSYLGVGIEAGDANVAKFEADIKVTAGASYQSAHGSIHANETEYSIATGQSQTGGEALVLKDVVSSACYSYDLKRGTTSVPDSSMRLCAINSSTQINASAESENGEASDSVAAIQWIPLQRDWASLSLFRPVTSNFDPSEAGSAAFAVDGRFSTTASSTLVAKPYIQIDLGAVRDISAIRVFPAADLDGVLPGLAKPLGFHNAAGTLYGFHLYAAQAPLSGNPPANALVDYAIDTIDGAVYDRWNIRTRDPGDSTQLLRARYIRLQYPDVLAIPPTLSVAQIQVFGRTHSEPPVFPLDVCDTDGYGSPTPDGLMQAAVWNPSDNGVHTIELRGDMLWSGAGDGSGVSGCANGFVKMWPIWDGIGIGGAGSTQNSTTNWALSEGSNYTNGTTSSFDASVSIGAEYDAKITGGTLSVQAGGSVEFTAGVTRDVQTSLSFGNSLNIGGIATGFSNNSAAVDCQFSPRPYAFHLIERGEAGFRHDMYVVDYTVPATFLRSPLPQRCREDPVFSAGMESEIYR